MMVDFNRVEAPERDDSVRPNGLACRLQGVAVRHSHFWPFIDRVPLVLSEYPDSGGEGVYFMVNDWHSPSLVDDELLQRGCMPDDPGGAHGHLRFRESDGPIRSDRKSDLAVLGHGLEARGTTARGTSAGGTTAARQGIVLDK